MVEYGIKGVYVRSEGFSEKRIRRTVVRGFPKQLLSSDSVELMGPFGARWGCGGGCHVSS